MPYMPNATPPASRHADSLTAAGFVGQGHHIATTSWDVMVKVWSTSYYTLVLLP